MLEICWGFASSNAFTLLCTCAHEFALFTEVRTPWRGGRAVVVYTREASHGALQPISKKLSFTNVLSYFKRFSTICFQNLLTWSYHNISPSSFTLMSICFGILILRYRPSPNRLNDSQSQSIIISRGMYWIAYCGFKISCTYSEVIVLILALTNPARPYKGHGGNRIQRHAISVLNGKAALKGPDIQKLI